MTQKNLLQSAGDGTAVPAGCIGEIKTSYASRGFTNNTSSGTGWSLFQSQTGDRTLTPGVWMVHYSVNIQVTSGNTSGTRSMILTTDSADGWAPLSNLTANGGASNLNFLSSSSPVGTETRSGTCFVRVTSAGIVNGTGFNIYAKIYAETHTSYTGTYDAYLLAIRIA